MLSKERLGREIQKIRKSKKITQQQLSSEICSQSEISRIEAGDFFPGIDLLASIAVRLNTPLTHFFDILSHEEVEISKEIKNRILLFSNKKKYHELTIYIEELMTSSPIMSGELEKFILWKKHLSSYYIRRIDAETCRIELSLLLLNKTVGTDVMIDLSIKNSIAIILAENQRYEESFSMYSQILANIPLDDHCISFKTKVLYNLGKLSFIQKKFEDSLRYTNEGIQSSIYSSDMSLLGQLYYQQGSLFEALGYSFDESSKAYKSSLVFFELLELPLYTEILHRNKASYLAKPE